MVWWKADTRVKLWLPPSEFQGTGALRPHPDGALPFVLARPHQLQETDRHTDGQLFFLGSPLCRMGWQEAVPGPQRGCHTSFCIWFTISLPEVLLTWPSASELCWPEPTWGQEQGTSAKIHTTRPETAACEIKTKQTEHRSNTTAMPQHALEPDTTHVWVKRAGEMH